MLIWIVLVGLAGEAWAEDGSPASGQGRWRTLAGPIGDGPWKFDSDGNMTYGCGHAYDPNNNLYDGWYEYYDLQGEKFIGSGGVTTWTVSVDTSKTSCTGGSPQVVATRAQTIAVMPVNLGAKVNAVKGRAWHSNGKYSVVATSGNSTTTATLYISKSGDVRREDFCVPDGFSWPRRADGDTPEVTWTITKQGLGGYPGTGCPKDQFLYSYVVTVNIDPDDVP